MGSETGSAKKKISMLLTTKNIQEIKDYHMRGTFPVFGTRFQKRDFKKKAKMFVTTSKGVLMREVNGGLLAAVGDDDKACIRNICMYAHDFHSHSKVGSSWKRIRAHWMGFKKQHLLDWVSKCAYCISKSQSPEKKAEFKHKIPVIKPVSASFSMERLQIDCISMAEYAEHNDGFMYAMHVMDVYSRYHFAYPLRDKSAREIVACLGLLFEKVGWPYIVQTELEPMYFSSEMADLLVSNKVLHVYPNEECAPSMKIITKTRMAFKKKLTGLMDGQKTEGRWIEVLGEMIAAWNSEFLLSTMTRPSRLFRVGPPDLEQYMQPPEHSERHI
ncbi:uncharacterized protein NEMAJ01_0388 [Nematocida major]|uniref:uncharacterized protein n=1 Tax=Nematocida major TaxID=1912982 RepID=UPI0020075883|nr:uncharacterized protein NEMAJ01_0388 [Nematocida major]KAH9385492.1 hypothetical protein NEMAJ01_0388 [Nematocida major]